MDECAGNAVDKTFKIGHYAIKGDGVKINTRIELACSKDRNRLAISEPYFDGKRILATTGTILAVIPVEYAEGETPDTEGYIPIKAIEHSKKTKKTLKGNINLTDGEVKITSDETKYKRHDLGKYPSIDNIIPAESKDDVTIKFNPQLLLNLALAIGSEGCVSLTFNPKSELKPIKVTPKSSEMKNPGAFGIIMPMR